MPFEPGLTLPGFAFARPVAAAWKRLTTLPRTLQPQHRLDQLLAARSLKIIPFLSLR